MAKITGLTRIAPQDASGQELVPVVKNGATHAAAIGDIVAPAALPFVTAAAGHEAKAQLAATSAAINGGLFDTIEAGLLATPEGKDFRVRGVGDTYAEDYRNAAGTAQKLPGALPSKAYMDGIAPAINNKVVALRRALGVDVENPYLDNGAAIRAAQADAMLFGKTIDYGTDTFRVGEQWNSLLPVTGKLLMRGDGAKVVALNQIRTKTFLGLRAPIEIDGIDFEGFSLVVFADTNGLDLSGHDIVLRNIKHTGAGGAVILTTLEDLRIRELIMENISVQGPLLSNGTGSGQGVRYQSNGFERAYLRNIRVENRNFQGVRVGGYPHGLVLNRHIHLESIHVDGVISTGQSNGVQAFGSDIFLDDIFVRGVDCINGSSSNVESVYTVGNSVNIGNITVENGGNLQGGIAIKSDQTRQHGPIRYRTKLHPRMNAAFRIDGSNAELTGGIEIEWMWEPVAASVASGEDGYAVTYTHLDVALTDTVDYYFVPHAINTSSAPTLKIGEFDAKPMMAIEQEGPIYPGQLRPNAIYKATYKPSRDNFEVRAVCWNEHIPSLPVLANNVALTAPLIDGAVYWIMPARTMTAGCTATIGASQPIPLKSQSADGLVDAAPSNGYPRAYYYSADDNALIMLARSGSPNSNDNIGRFVPELAGSANSYTFNHPYPADYSDALFVLFPDSNTGAATFNGEPLLTASGVTMPAGYVIPRVIYQLTRDGTNWRASKIGDSFEVFDVLNGAQGRQVIKDVTLINAQYSSVINSRSSGLTVIEGIKTLGRSRIRRSVVTGGLSPTVPIKAQVFAKNISLGFYYGDQPEALVGGVAWLDLLDVSDMPPPRVRGAILASTGSTIVSGVTTADSIARLRMRNCQKGPLNGGASGVIGYPASFASIDSDHVTEITNVNPPSIAPNGYFEFTSSYTHLGAEPGDDITVTHEFNTTRVRFGGYCIARNTVRVFMEGDPNPAGSPVDIAAGRLFITSRRSRS